MTQEDAYEVLELAENSDHPIGLREAAECLGYGSSRGVARRISCAWDYLESIGEHRSAAIIARSFVDRNYRFPWQ